jgi:hypothetical protein
VIETCKKRILGEWKKEINKQTNKNKEDDVLDFDAVYISEKCTVSIFRVEYGL